MPLAWVMPGGEKRGGITYSWVVEVCLGGSEQHDRLPAVLQCPGIVLSVVAPMTAQESAPARGVKKPLTVAARSTGTRGVLVIQVAGQVDLVTVQQLRGYLARQVRLAPRAVVLDLAEVSFLAACGIGVLLEFAHHLRAKGTSLRLVVRHRKVLRALEVTGTDGLIPRSTTVAEAVARCSA